MINQALVLKPGLKDYVIEYWDELKGKSIIDIKKELLEICLMPKEKEMSSFQFWFNNKKKAEREKIKKNLESDDSQANSKLLQQVDLANQIYVKQVEDLLDKLFLLEKSEKLIYLREKIEKHPFLIIKFMENRQTAPSGDFLELIVKICYELKDDISLQTKLFVRVCALHFQERLNINEQLLKRALTELSTVQTDQNAAYGFLKMTYQNDIPLVNFPIEHLNTFQLRYNLVFARFYDYLSEDIVSLVLDCLPPTCFLFTEPFYRVLKEGGNDLYEHITPDYLPFIINLLAYSFENDYEPFKEFLTLFKKCCLQLSGLKIDIISLINAIHQQEIEKNPKFFGSIKNTLKILIMSQKLIQKLVEANDEELRLRSKQPKQIGCNKEDEEMLKQYIQLFTKKNQDLSSLMVNMPFTANEDIKKLLELLELFDINQMNQVQFISFHVMETLFEKEKIFQQFETGIGKTTLSLIFMLQVHQKNQIKIFSIYQQGELCYRDFNRLQEIVFDLNINCLFINKEEQINLIQNASIVFIIDKMFEKLQYNEQVHEQLKESLVIMDEFDSILFELQKSKQELELYTQSKYLIGFTGSQLGNIHQQLLKKLFDSSLIKYPLTTNVNGSQNICRESIAFFQRNEQMNYLQKVCLEQCLLTPILLILDKAGQNKFIEINKKDLKIVDLSKMTCIQIEAHFKNCFLFKTKDRYQVCLISSKQGRGIDVPSNSEIEQNGGVTVIIADLPNNPRDFEQFKGRTKRMLNKGQYYIILWNNLTKFNEGFLQGQLDIAQQEEQMKLNELVLSWNQIDKKQIQVKQTVDKVRYQNMPITILQNCEDEELNNDVIISEFLDQIALQQKLLLNESIKYTLVPSIKNIEQQDDKNLFKEREQLLKNSQVQEFQQGKIELSQNQNEELVLQLHPTSLNTSNTMIDKHRKQISHQLNSNQQLKADKKEQALFAFIDIHIRKHLKGDSLKKRQKKENVKLNQKKSLLKQVRNE